jgi:hypothetical protein
MTVTSFGVGDGIILREVLLPISSLRCPSEYFKNFLSEALWSFSE